MNPEGAQRPARTVATAVVILLIAVALVFLPLGLAFIESITSGTHFVERFCRDIGIYHFLDAIYDPILDVVR